MTDCHCCAALKIIAFDATLTAAEMVQLAREAMNDGEPCGLQSTESAMPDHEKALVIAERNYDPDDPHNPVLELLLPSILKNQAGL